MYGDEERELAAAELNERGQLLDLRCASTPLLGPDFDDAHACGHDSTGDAVTLYRSNGKLAARKWFAQGRLVRNETYFDSGKLQSQQEQTADGTVERTFSEAGVKRSEVQWSGTGKQRSKMLEQLFQERGGLSRERRWKAGRLVLEITWYSNGQMQREREAVTWNDQPATHDTRYRDNGNKSSEGTYVNREDTYGEQKVGVHRFYDEEGRPRRELELDDTGRPTRERTWDDTGQLLTDDRLQEDGTRHANRR
jgi:antitoxin component YwqK of YwqJK toxin-antitoxin module